MRRSLVVAGVLVAIAFVLVGGPALLTSTSTSDVAPEDEPDPEIVTPGDSESGFWPYLNSRRSHEKRSPINLVVHGDTERIVELLSEEADGDWNETELDHFEDQSLAEAFGLENGTTTENGTDDDSVDRNGTDEGQIDRNGTGEDRVDRNETDDENGTFELLPSSVPWTTAAGGTRYAYLDPGPDGDAFWTTETVQLDDGDYYGQRYHIRLYESPNDEDDWVAMQTHTEHFDWFTLRHRVDGAKAAQNKLEADLVSIPGIDERDGDVVRRINLGNGGPSDADGWATEVDLTAAGAAVPVLVGLATWRRLRRRARDGLDRHLTDADRRRLDATIDRVEARHLLLVGTIVALFLGVRLAGVALERNAGFLSMHEIAGLLYPVIGLGIPIATYLIASGLERRLDAAAAAGTSLAVAIWIDYGLLGIDRLPIDVVAQRILVVVALGLIAGGAARRATRESRWNDMLVVGVVLWTLVLVGTLFGYL